MKKMFFAVLFLLISFAAFAADAEISRHTFTTAITDREPVDSVKAIDLDKLGAISYFTELKNMENEKVTHVWKKNGETVHTITFSIGGNRWRTNSSMKQALFLHGDIITVEVVDQNGSSLVIDTLTIEGEAEK